MSAQSYVSRTIAGAYHLAIVVDLHHLSNCVTDMHKLEKLDKRGNAFVYCVICRLVAAHLFRGSATVSIISFEGTERSRCSLRECWLQMMFRQCLTQNDKDILDGHLDFVSGVAG